MFSDFFATVGPVPVLVAPGGEESRNSVRPHVSIQPYAIRLRWVHLPSSPRNTRGKDSRNFGRKLDGPAETIPRKGMAAPSRAGFAEEWKCHPIKDCTGPHWLKY